MVPRKHFALLRTVMDARFCGRSACKPVRAKSTKQISRYPSIHFDGLAMSGLAFSTSLIRRHHVASSGRRVAPPWPRRMTCLSPEVGSVVVELVCLVRAPCAP